MIADWSSMPLTVKIVQVVSIFVQNPQAQLRATDISASTGLGNPAKILRRLEAAEWLILDVVPAPGRPPTNYYQLNPEAIFQIQTYLAQLPLATPQEPDNYGLSLGAVDLLRYLLAGHPDRWYQPAEVYQAGLSRKVRFHFEELHQLGWLDRHDSGRRPRYSYRLNAIGLEAAPTIVQIGFDTLLSQPELLGSLQVAEWSTIQVTTQTVQVLNVFLASDPGTWYFGLQVRELSGVYQCYRILGRLEQLGWLVSWQESESSRTRHPGPARVYYRLTAAGAAQAMMYVSQLPALAPTALGLLDLTASASLIIQFLATSPPGSWHTAVEVMHELQLSQSVYRYLELLTDAGWVNRTVEGPRSISHYQMNEYGMQQAALHLSEQTPWPQFTPASVAVLGFFLSQAGGWYRREVIAEEIGIPVESLVLQRFEIIGWLKSRKVRGAPHDVLYSVTRRGIDEGAGYVEEGFRVLSADSSPTVHQMEYTAVGRIFQYMLQRPDLDYSLEAISAAIEVDAATTFYLLERLAFEEIIVIDRRIKRGLRARTEVTCRFTEQGQLDALDFLHQFGAFE